ncbi:GntR family transcriptional regulator [Nocardia sp. NPDC051981]|uniref:GntR family transcriptional regulator n=1 Tax=Nocardia sp. NPDC051981 TaxID=3155417 RepID=UPI0034308A57
MSLTDDVYERIKDQILRVQRAPGTAIYEAELATEYGVSKTPVREALRLLSQTGWVVVLPRKGYLVRPVELRDIRDIFAVRRMIEPEVAAAAAARATADDLELLARMLGEQHNASGTDAALGAASAFHLALADIGGNPRVRTILQDLTDEVRRLHYLLPQIEEHITSVEELRAHDLILTALRDRDSERARQLTIEHLNEVAQTLVRGFSGV